MTQNEKQQLLNGQHTLIHDREAQLRATDYIAAKIAEGQATRAEYEQQIARRQQWRDDINAAQERITELEATETEVPELQEIGETE